LNYPTASEQAAAEAGVVPADPVPSEDENNESLSPERTIANQAVRVHSPSAELAAEPAQITTPSTTGRRGRTRKMTVRALESLEQQASVHNLGELLPGEIKIANPHKRRRVIGTALTPATRQLDAAGHAKLEELERVVKERVAAGQRRIERH
jgi:hypothetical protein